MKYAMQGISSCHMVHQNSSTAWCRWVGPCRVLSDVLNCEARWGSLCRLLACDMEHRWLPGLLSRAQSGLEVPMPRSSSDWDAGQCPARLWEHAKAAFLYGDRCAGFWLATWSTGYPLIFNTTNLYPDLHFPHIYIFFFFIFNVYFNFLSPLFE